MSMAGLVFVDLVLDNGQLVRIECPAKHEDELHDSLEASLKTRSWWAPGRFDRCTAQFLGHNLDRVDMGRVVGLMR
jgi:hypothetical protein